MKFFVFYSNTCQYCEKLLRTIQNEKLNDRCQLICFESHPDKIPDFITNVPTIVAKNLSKPLVGLEAIEWVENKKYFNQTTNNIITNNVINPNIKSALDEFAFNKAEAISISDHYTNINDINIDKTMMDYNKINIDAPITNDITNKKILDTKINDEIQEQKLKELISLRRHQIYSRSSGASKIKT